MANTYWASTINGGGTGAMDGIDPTDTDGSATALAVGDTCTVKDGTNNIKATYVARSSAGKSEIYPTIIIPDTNPSNWYWELIEITYRYQSGASASLIYANTPGAF